MKRAWHTLWMSAWLASGIGAGAPAHAGDRQDGLPQRNLLVEWRVSGQGASQRSQTGIRTGQIIVDSQGHVVGRTGIGLESYQTESSSDTTQQVQVLNGAKARLFVGRSQPYTVWQWAWSGASGGGTLGVIGPQGGGAGSGSGPSGAGGPSVNVLPQTVWIDLGQGLTVRPRWPGGRAPVVVELEAQVRQPMQGGGPYGGQVEPDGQTRHLEAASTLTVSLGEWAVVARSGGRTQQQRSGTWSTRDVDSSQSEQLEIRVTAP